MKNWEWVEAESESNYVAIVMWLPKFELVGKLASVVDLLGGRIVQCREVEHAPMEGSDKDAA